MTQEALRAWLTLYFTPRLGPKGLARLQTKDSLENIVHSSPSALSALGFTSTQIEYIRHGSTAYVEQCFEWQQQSEDNHILCLQDADYPPLLKQVSAPPAILFVSGRRNVLAKPQVAIVGSRNASVDGLASAKSFAKSFAEQGLVVTSGLALGIDGHAHDGALQGNGETIAVLGCGLQNIYPARHRKLAERVRQEGALVSEFHPTIQPKAANFPRRNRIISGLSVGVMVIEAAEKSGSLITARYAAEQGREVFALPGSIHHPQSRGCNSLIKQGACLVQSVEDVVNEIETLLRWSDINKPLQQQPKQNDWIEQIDSKQQLPFADLLANVGNEVTPVDILAQRTNIPVHEVMLQLLELELSGHVVAVSGGYIRKGRG